MIIYLLVYVDDIIIMGSSSAHVMAFINVLSVRFSLKDLEELSYFLGVGTTRSADGLFLNQRKYIVDLLRQVHMDNTKPVSTLFCSFTPLTLHGGTPLDNSTDYRMVVASLLYFSFTRPDISFAVILLSQFMHQPTSDHWNAAKRVLVTWWV